MLLFLWLNPPSFYTTLWMNVVECCALRMVSDRKILDYGRPPTMLAKQKHWTFVTMQRAGLSHRFPQSTDICFSYFDLSVFKFGSRCWQLIVWFHIHIQYFFVFLNFNLIHYRFRENLLPSASLPNYSRRLFSIRLAVLADSWKKLMFKMMWGGKRINSRHEKW